MVEVEIRAMSFLRGGLCFLLVSCVAVPVYAQEGYVGISGRAKFSWGDVVNRDSSFLFFAYPPYASCNSSSCTALFYFSALSWDGFANDIGVTTFSGGTTAALPGILSFSLPTDVVVFVPDQNRIFRGSDPVYAAGFPTKEGFVSWSDVRDLQLRLDFSPSAPIPEAATWGLMIAGFGLVGARLRGRRPIPARP